MNNNSKTLSSFSNSTSKAKKTSYSSNFIEALKDQAKTATFGVGSQAIDQIAGRAPQTPQQEAPQQPFNFAEYLQLRERKIRQQERLFAQRQQTTEILVYHRKEEAAQKEVELIKQEIKTLAVQTGKLSSELGEAEKAVSGRTPDIKTGTYYISFFERIRNLIKLAKKRITESRTWLQIFNSRAKAKCSYWGQFKKSGTKFLLSQERYMATQAG